MTRESPLFSFKSVLTSPSESCPETARSITSVMVCHFMLSLRQFDSAVVSSMQSVSTLPVRDHTATERAHWHQFPTQLDDSLPVFIASFSQPLHVDSSASDNDTDAIVDGNFQSSAQSSTPFKLESPATLVGSFLHG